MGRAGDIAEERDLSRQGVSASSWGEPGALRCRHLSQSGLGRRMLKRKLLLALPETEHPDVEMGDARIKADRIRGGRSPFPPPGLPEHGGVNSRRVLGAAPRPAQGRGGVCQRNRESLVTLRRLPSRKVVATEGALFSCIVRLFSPGVERQCCLD